jgi:hypothetical protein
MTVNGRVVRLFARAGAVCISELTETGEQELTELRRVRTTRRDGKGGSFRWFNEYALPEGGTVTERLDTTDEDVARKLNRAENARQLPLPIATSSGATEGVRTLSRSTVHLMTRCFSGVRIHVVPTGNS